MLVNKASTSKLVIWRSLFWVKISSTKVKESFTVNWFCVTSDRTATKSFASFYVGIPVAERIDLNDGNPLIKSLWILGDRWSVLGFEASGLSLL